MPLDHDLETGAEGELVKELHEALVTAARHDPLRTVFADGRFVEAFAAERSAARYGDATAQAVAFFQRSHGIEGSGKADAPTRAAIKRVLGIGEDREAVAADAESGGASGEVADDFGFGRPDVTLILEHVRAGGAAVEIARGRTRRDGTFELGYPRGDLLRRFGRLHLRVVAVADERRLARTAVVINAPPEVAGLQLVVADDGGRNSSEFERIAEDAIGRTRELGLALDALDETEDRPDISLLSAETVNRH